MKLISSRLVVVSQLLFSALGAQASSVTYSYLGNPFTQLSNGSSFTLLDFVSGTVTLNSALPTDSGLTSYSTDLIAVNFSDGVDIIDTFNPNDIIEFGTSNGQISRWNLAIFTGISGYQINTQYSSPTGMDNYDEGLSGSGNFGLNAYDPGGWASSSAPEPSPGSVVSGTVILSLAIILLRRRWLPSQSNLIDRRNSTF
jgi:hypothetical protein